VIAGGGAGSSKRDSFPKITTASAAVKKEAPGKKNQKENFQRERNPLRALGEKMRGGIVATSGKKNVNRNLILAGKEEKKAEKSSKKAQKNRSRH